MHKSLKKTLAILLAVLMLAFSVPFNAFAANSPTFEDLGLDITTVDQWDSGLSVHVYAMPYGSENNWGPIDESGLNDDQDAVEEMVFFDLTNMTVDELAEYSLINNKNYTGNYANFVLIFMLEGVENLDNPPKLYNMFFDYDSNYLAPVKLNARGNNTATGAKVNVDGNMDTTGTSSAYNGTDRIYLFATGLDGCNSFTEYDFGVDDGIENATLPGILMGAFGFNLLDDCDLTEVITASRDIKDVYIALDGLDYWETWTALYGGYSTANNKQQPSYFTMPEWGVVAGDTPDPTPTKVLYTFADGSTTELDQNAAAPANTAATTAKNNDGTHTVTTYSWVADGANFTEQANPTTNGCDYNEAVTNATSCAANSGYTTYTCKVCGYETVGNYTSLPHDFSAVKSSTAGDCQTEGTTVYECAYGCGETDTVTGVKGDHVAGAIVTENVVTGDCTTNATHDEVVYCSVEGCGAELSRETVTDKVADGHKAGAAVVENPVTPTCTDDGSYEDVVYCSVCSAELSRTPVVDPAKGHDDGVEKLVDSKEATRTEDGYEMYETRCTVDGALLDSRKVVLPATGAQITVLGSDLGTVTLNGTEVSNETVGVPVGTMYTLVATPTGDAEFVGWDVNGKIVSNDSTYATAAYADTTYEPVFALGNASSFSVVFVDMFGNVITILDSDAVAALAEMPAAPVYGGLTFTTWDADLDDVKAATSDMVVTARYEASDSAEYTITVADGATITVDGVKAEGTTATAKYNSSVTVTAPGATAWTANGATVSYVESYTFRCGSDVNLTFDTTAAVAAPEVAVISADKTETYRVKFLATRSVPDGYTLIESGFVYGKAMAVADLVLDNVGTTQGAAGATVKQVTNSNIAADGQFALTYGVSNMDGAACARAYMIVKNTATNEISVVYSNSGLEIFNY